MRRALRYGAAERRLLFDSVLLGLVGALSSQLFLFLLRISQLVFLTWLARYTPPGLPNEGGVLWQVIGPYGLWLVPAATTLGGLLAGILVYSIAPEAEGHGTDTVVFSIHRSAGHIRARVPLLKLVASAITIGSGGSAGREGPTALISAGVGSIYARFRHRSEDERRLLVLIGMAAGLSAIFRSPIGTAVFAIEVLYGRMEFEAGALLYTLIAAVVAYVLNSLFVGWGPLFRVPPDLPLPSLTEYAWYAVLGVASGVMATVLPVFFYSLRDLFHRIPIPPHFKPAIGGLGLGMLALAVPQVLGGGYGWIQLAIDGRLGAGLLTAVVFGKVIALSLSVASGGSGGVFAPSLCVGAMLGALFGELIGVPSAAFTVVGMAAVFGGAARVPIATLLMVTEMTGGYTLLVPAALAVAISFFLQTLLSSRLRYHSMYEGQVSTWTESPAHLEEHLRRAFESIARRHARFSSSIGHLDLAALLETGVPVDLPGGRQLVAATLPPWSPALGVSLADLPRAPADALEIVGILRRTRTELPRADLTLEEGDRLLAIATPEAWASFVGRLAPPTPTAVEPA